MKHFTNSYYKKIGALALFGFLTLFAAWQIEKVFVLAGGARLYFDTTSGSYAVGKSFTVNVLLDSGGGLGVNAADGTISYDSNYLSVTGVSKNNSIFSLWTSNPSYSDAAGTIKFSGGNPSAYSDSGGNVIAVTFKVVKSGSTGLSFTSGSALAADGKGTNVLSDTGKASFTLTDAAAAPPPPPPAPPAATSPAATGPAPEGAAGGFNPSVVIASPSHPDQTKWYAVKNAVFTWKLSPDLTDVSTALTTSATTNPAKTSEGAIEQKEFDGLADGTSYFHARFKNQDGTWSQTLHYQVNIDTVAPETFTAKVDASNKDAPPTITFTATDKTSGIDHYTVKVDAADPISVFGNQLVSSTYTMQPVLPGTHKLVLQVLDKAGNAASISQDLVLAGTANVEIRNSPGVIQENDPVIVQGVADANAVIDTRVSQNGKILSDENTKADEDGNWTYIYRKHLPQGDYDITAKMTTKAGAETDFTDKTLLTVTGLPFLDKYGLLLIMFLLFVIAGVVIFGFYERREFLKKKLVVKRETDEMRDKTEAIFAALHEEVEEKIKLLDPANAEKMGVKPLDANDILEKFKEALDISHDTVAKEVDDVEKALD